ncbi:MAG: hypothetical protein MRJ66_09950 [Nitrospira sp.]|nr:hypothetical protein [Nitrospira sp.]
MAVESGQCASKELCEAALRDFRDAAPYAAQEEIERFYTRWTELDNKYLHCISRKS